MNSKKKTTIAIIITIIIGLMTIAGTFALWTVQVGNNITVALNVADLSSYVEYTEGNAVFNSNLEASTDYTGGNSTTFTLNTKNNPPYDFYGAIYMKINSIGDVITEGDAIKITITSKANDTNEDEIIEYENSFYGMSKGDTIRLLPSILATSTKMDYNVYIWVDSSNPDILSVVGATIDVEFWMEVNQYRASNYYNGNSTPNAPELVTGLIPVVLSDNGATVTTISSSDTTWYDYNNKKWANAVLVTDSSRSTYNGTDGVTVTQSDILAYYVWIPRYSYRVWQFGGVSDTGKEQEIEIKFIDTSIIEPAHGNGYWYTHPAFWWDDDSDGVRDSGEELSGIWVGKFETSHNTLSSSTDANSLGTDDGATICNSTGCANYSGLRVLPNVVSLRYNRISNFFNASRFMESTGNPFGLTAATVDSHMMKNSEWGAVAYLSHSKYGINDEIRINAWRTFTTGCGALNADESYTSACGYTYGSATTYPQSTTGNVTGVFDMSGGTFEYVMGHYGTTTTYGSSGFSSTYPLPDSKYYNNYDSTQFTGTMINNTNIDLCTLATCGGHALNETKSWYSDYVDFLYSSSPWLMRGGYNSQGANAGVFDIDNNSGGFTNLKNSSFRLVLIPE